MEFRRVLFLAGSVVIASCAAAPAVAVAVKVTGLPVSPLAVAVRVLVPGVVPSVHDVTAAMPLPFVATLVGLAVPPPDVTAKATRSEERRVGKASRTSTDGGVATAVPTVADWPSPPFSVIVAAAPALSGIALEVAGLRLVASKRSV